MARCVNDLSLNYDFSESKERRSLNYFSKLQHFLFFFLQKKPPKQTQKSNIFYLETAETISLTWKIQETSTIKDLSGVFRVKTDNLRAHPSHGASGSQ